MRNSLAVVAVALFGFWLFLTGFPWIFAVAAGYFGSLLAAVAPLAGLLFVIFRRRIAAWLVRGSETDTGVFALAVVRGVGLLLFFHGLTELAQVLSRAMIETVGETYAPPWWEPLRGATAAAVMAAGLVLLSRPAGVAQALDGQPEESPQAVRFQAILYGAIALWVLITDVPRLFGGVFQVWVGRDEFVTVETLLRYIDLPEMLASLIRVVVACFIFISRDRIAAFWHRLRPMT
jgi:hypothetical protein